MNRALLTLPLALAVSACAPPLQDEVNFTRSKSSVNVVWAQDIDDLQDKCEVEPGDRQRCGCAAVAGKHALIFALPPRHWYDNDRWAVLGHELGHAFGARHEGDVVMRCR